MRKSFISFFAILLVLSTTSVFAQTKDQPKTQAPEQQNQEQSKVPDLPDFNNAPYFLLRTGGFTSMFHPELGDLKGNWYQDDKDDPETNHKADPQNMIMIFYNEDGSQKYAEWISYNDTQSKATKRWIRGYSFKDGKWVLESEAKQERAVPLK